MAAEAYFHDLRVLETEDGDRVVLACVVFDGPKEAAWFPLHSSVNGFVQHAAMVQPEGEVVHRDSLSGTYGLSLGKPRGMVGNSDQVFFDHFFILKSERKPAGTGSLSECQECGALAKRLHHVAVSVIAFACASCYGRRYAKGAA